ncbi:MAG: YgjV family protein [Oscillospiraceae bacterium]|nr:YgjV family protein [Oscillospiraceae bacterium]
MDWEFIIIQAIGLMGNIAVIGAVQFNNRKVVLGAQALACVLWSIHYGALGAMTALFTNFISFGRSAVFYFNDRKWAKSRFWLALFLGLFILNSFLTWEGWRSILPAIGMCATTLALWTRDETRLRLLYLCSSPPWLIYNILCGSYSCTVIECFALVSYISAIWRFDIKKIHKKGSEHNA